MDETFVRVKGAWMYLYRAMDKAGQTVDFFLRQKRDVIIPREMIASYAILKKAAAIANHDSKRLDDRGYKLIVQTCDEILAGQHYDMFPLHVWMAGSGTQFNMNVNEVISNRCCQLAGTPLGSKTPVHPNDHVNMAQSSNDSFPDAMYIAAAVNVKQRLAPAVMALRDAINDKAVQWQEIVKIGRTGRLRPHRSGWDRRHEPVRTAC
jgi:fumarate hydratase class II